MANTYYKLKLTPLHANQAVKNLLPLVSEKTLKMIHDNITKDGLVKLKVLETRFVPTNGRKVKSTPESQIKKWFKAVKSLEPGSNITLLYSLPKGTIFRYTNGKTEYVYDGQLTKGRYHFHLFSDANHIKSTPDGLKEVITDFTF